MSIQKSSLDFSSILKANLPRKIVQPRRSQIYVGFQCHQGCGFCYYKHSCSQEMFQLDFMKKQVDFKLAYGIQDFEITGGEPGECKCLLELCRYIKTKLSSSKIAIITNGTLLAQPQVLESIDEVLLSYHCSRKQIADKTMFPHGCTWEKVSSLAKLAHSKGLLVRTNTVLGTFNLNGIETIVDDLVELQPAIVNFLPVNLFDQAESMASFIDYTKLRPKLKRLIGELSQQLPKTLIFARYMPFCDMSGYESHLVGYLQHIYDWFDWNVELGGSDFLDKVGSPSSQRDFQTQLQAYGSSSVGAALEARHIFYSKPTKCLRCQFQLICDGIERKIPKQKIEEFAVPCESGRISKNFLEFIQEPTKSLYDQIYSQSKSNANLGA